MPTSSELFQEMADHTRPKCGGEQCGNPGPDRCCSPLYCGLAESEMATRGISLPHQDHPRLIFMGPTGCIIPPHLRPLCTLHQCKISSLGEDPLDPLWTERYFELREAINIAWYEEHSDGHG